MITFTLIMFLINPAGEQVSYQRDFDTLGACLAAEDWMLEDSADTGYILILSNCMEG